MSNSPNRTPLSDTSCLSASCLCISATARYIVKCRATISRNDLSCGRHRYSNRARFSFSCCQKQIAGQQNLPQYCYAHHLVATTLQEHLKLFMSPQRVQDKVHLSVTADTDQKVNLHKHVIPQSYVYTDCFFTISLNCFALATYGVL